MSAQQHPADQTDSSGQNIIFSVINDTEIKYRVKAPSSESGTFKGVWDDILNETNGTIADTSVAVKSAYHGGGGGGGGYVPTTPTPSPTPVVKKVSGILSIEAGQMESVTFEGLDVRKISIEVDKNVSGVSVMVEKVDKPTEITTAPGIVFDYINITTTNLTDVNVTAKIEFKVSKSWIADENVNETTIKLNRYDGNWTALSTSKISEDNASVYFEAEIYGFSIFAVSGEKEKEVEAAATATPAPVTTPTPKSGEETSTPTPQALPAKAPAGNTGLIVAIIIASAIAIICIATYFLVWKRKGEGEGKELIFPGPIHQSLYDSFKYPSFLMEKMGDGSIW
jgi:PGF-pre-PGF domain-containing protein